MDGWWAYILQESDKEKRELCPTCYRDVIYLDGSFTGPVCPKGHLTSSSELVTLVNSEVIKP
ncbi:MAG: hypothetical protein ABIE22_04620 [archaeon]